MNRVRLVLHGAVVLLTIIGARAALQHKGSEQP